MPQHYLQLSLLKTWFMSILRRKKFLKGAWQKATYSKQQTSNQMPPPENTTKNPNKPNKKNPMQNRIIPRSTIINANTYTPQMAWN